LGSMNHNRPLTHADLLQLKRWNTPTIYNGWEQITQRNPGGDAFNLEETRDFMPQMGPMVGYAVTVVIEPGNRTHREANPNGWQEYRRYIASVLGPKIVMVQDLDKPRVIGSLWGEVNSNTHRALGCVGTITDGAIRDLDEMTNAGFKALARRLCVGHAFAHPVRWNCEVEVFGRTVRPGDLNTASSWCRPKSNPPCLKPYVSWTRTSAAQLSRRRETPPAEARRKRAATWTARRPSSARTSKRSSSAWASGDHQPGRNRSPATRRQSPSLDSARVWPR
jgi:4-hydroxy-4-methyl-2-oxoglutarate aldolase